MNTKKDTQISEFNWELLTRLVMDVPDGLDRKKKKEKVSKEMLDRIKERDNSTCQVCSLKNTYYRTYSKSGKLARHHIIPNGEATEENLITLCNWCHNVVHILLWKTGKWRFVPLMMKTKLY